MTTPYRYRLAEDRVHWEVGRHVDGVWSIRGMYGSPELAAQACHALNRGESAPLCRELEEDQP